MHLELLKMDLKTMGFLQNVINTAIKNQRSRWKNMSKLCNVTKI